MGGAVVLLLLLVVSLRAQAQVQEELSKEGILCIMRSHEETALERWLHCLHPKSSQDPSTEQLNSFRATLNVHQDPQPTIDEDDAQDQPTADTGSCQPVHLTVNEGEFLAENKLPGDGIQDKGGGHGDSAPVHPRFENGEEASSSHFQILEMRATEDDALLGWLKLNLVLLALCKLLFGLAKKCSQKTGGKKSSELSTICLAEDSMEAAPEFSKAAFVDDTPSKKHSENACLPMLGSSLGSAVGAVFAEVLLKTCSSGSSVPTDKISMLLESALKDLSILVQGDDGCSRLVGDFISSFKSTYTTMYRIHQACASYGGSRETNLQLQRDNGSILKPTCEKQCTIAKSNEEIICAPGTHPSDDTGQIKQGLPLQASSDNSKQVKLESGLDAFSDQLKRLSLLDDHGECDSGALATSTVENQDSALPIGFKSIEKSEACYERREIPSCFGNNDDIVQTSLSTVNFFKNKVVTELEYEVDDASSVCEEPPSLMQSNTVGRLDALALIGQGYGTTGCEFQKDFLKVYERHVQVQEQHNQIKFVELKHLMKQQILEEEKIQLTYAANGLMRENIDLGRSKANFRENRVLEKQARAAYMSFSTTCADELAAGLFVMLSSLVYSVRKYSFALLNDLVSTCQPSVKETRRSFGFHIDWFYNSLDLLAGKLQALVCHFTVTGRILIGSILVGAVAWSLLRRSVTNSSQAMPATILIIVLGGVCGFVGKVSVDSLGGCGNRWWAVWGAFCLLHALTNCFTPSVYRLVHGSPTSCKSRFGLPFWIRRLAFHATLVLVLPVLAGLLPFGSLSLVMNDLFLTSGESLAGVIYSLTEWSAQLF